MAEVSNEIIDLTSDNGIKKLEAIFNYARIKLQKVELKIGDFLKSHGFDSKLSQNYDGKLDGRSKTQTENIYNNQVLPLLKNYKSNKHILNKKELIIKLSQLIEQAEMQEKFVLSQSTGRNMNGLNIEKKEKIEAELLSGINEAFHAQKLDIIPDKEFEKTKNNELKGLLSLLAAGKISHAEFEKKYFIIVKEAGKLGGLPMQARLLENFGKVAKPMMSSGVAPMLLMISKKTRRILPGLPVLIGGGIYASLFITLKSNKISGWDKTKEVGKTIGETGLNIAPITGTVMSAIDTYHAYKRGDKSEAIACGIGTLVSAGFDAMTVVLVATGVGIPGAVGLQAVKNASIRGIVKFGLKPALKFAAKETVEVAVKEASLMTGKQVAREFVKEGTKVIIGNSKVVYKGLRHNTGRMLFGKKEGGELISRGLVHETIDGARQIFTFKHITDIAKNKFYMKKFLKNPEKLKASNFKKFKEMEELSKQKGTIKHGLIVESKLAEHNSHNNEDLNLGSDKLSEREQKRLLKSKSEREQKFNKEGNQSELEKYLPEEFVNNFNISEEQVRQKMMKKSLKFESYLQALEGETSIKGTEDLISKLEKDISLIGEITKNVESLDYSKGISKEARDLILLGAKKQGQGNINEKLQRNIQKAYKNERDLKINQDHRSDLKKRIEKILGVLEDRSHSPETAEHQQLFYKNIEKILKDGTVGTDIKKMIFEHLTSQHINDNLVKNNSLQKIISSILDDKKMNLSDRLDFLSLLKTEKNIVSIDSGKNTKLERFAGIELESIIKNIEGFNPELKTPESLNELKNNFYEYNKLIKSFDYNLDLKLSNVTECMVKNFEHLQTPTKILFISFLKKHNMLNSHIETNEKFAGNILKLVEEAINNKNTNMNIRGAINLCSYIEGTRFENVGKVYRKLILSGENNGINSEELSKLVLTGDVFNDPKLLAIKHKKENIQNEELFSSKNQNDSLQSKKTEIISTISNEVLSGDTKSVLGYLYEISKEPTPFSSTVYQAVIKGYFSNLKEGKKAEDMVIYCKELCTFIKDQPKNKTILPIKDIQKSIIEFLRTSDVSKKDEKIALCKILELFPLEPNLFLKLGEFEKTILAKKMLNYFPEKNIEQNETVNSIINNLLNINEADSVDMMHKISGLSYLQANIDKYPKKFQSILRKKLWNNGESVIEKHVNNLNKNSQALINELFGFKKSYVGKNREDKTLNTLAPLGLELEITKNGEFYLNEVGGGNRIDLDIDSKLNAGHDYIELALSKSPIINSGEKDNITKIAKILKQIGDDVLLKKLENSGSHASLSHIAGILNESKNLNEVPPELIGKFLKEYEGKIGETELGEKFVLQNTIIQKYLQDSVSFTDYKSRETYYNEQYYEVAMYIENLMKRKDPYLLNHQLSLIANLGYNKKVQKNAYKNFLNNRIKNAEELESLLVHPLFKQIHNNIGVDYKYTNHEIAKEIREISFDKEISGEKFNRLFVLAELIKNKSNFYVETKGNKDTFNELKESFNELIKNKDDLISNSMINKLLEIKELIKDKDVIKYVEIRLHELPAGSEEATILMNRFFDGIYKDYKTTSEIGFNAHDRAIFKSIQEVVQKHLLAVNIKGGQMSGEEFESKLDTKTKELLHKNNIGIAGIENGKVQYKDLRTGEKLSNLESFQVIRTEKIIQKIEQYIAIAVKSAINSYSENVGGSNVKDEILKNLSPDIIQEMQKLKIDIKTDEKLIKIMEFQNAYRSSTESNKSEILSKYEKILGDSGIKLETTNNNGKNEISFIDEGTEEKVDLTKLVDLIDLTTGKKITSNGMESIRIIDSILTKVGENINILRTIKGSKKDSEKVAKEPNLGDTKGMKAFWEIMGTPKAKAVTTLAVTFGLMKAKNAMAMDQSILDLAEKDAKNIYENNPEYKNINTPDSRKKEIKEETIRNLTVSRTQELFDSMQKQVDKKLDEVVSKSLNKIGDSRITPIQKELVKKLFKEELYRYMYKEEDTKLEGTYNRAEGRKSIDKQLFTEGWTNSIFESEIFNILKNINKRLTNKISDIGLDELKTKIYGEFNNM
ncbi:MAG: hypothetical protein PHZ26_03095 [Candidatus Gracilibacteria bacterium]|nr:hypothetical protein [Candidatus Gracilibacteria bacterium]MDD2908714.1 hypothetical protein [Candidatus Gracilibacteria bacterium]